MSRATKANPRKRKRSVDEDDETTVDVVELRRRVVSAFESANHWHALDVVRNQPPVRALVGLMLGQGKSFDRARRQRRQLFKYLDSSLESKEPKEVAKHIQEISDATWTKWAVSDTIRDAIRSAVRRWQQDGSADALLVDGDRIGPWTRKGYQILCTDDSRVLLTEDPWVRKRWQQLTGVPYKRMPLTVDICDRDLRMAPTDVSRLLWRLADKGGSYGDAKSERLPRDCFL